MILKSKSISSNSTTDTETFILMYTVLSVFCFPVDSVFVKVVYCFEVHNLDTGDFSSLRTMLLF